MSARLRLIAAPAVVAVAGLAWWLGSDAPTRAAAPVAPGSTATTWSTPTHPMPSALPAVATTAGAATLPAPLTAFPIGTTASLDEARAFRTDARGQLVLDERTRLATEKLVALNGPDALPALVNEQTAGLPAEAAAQARDLVERYGAYESARRGTFQPGTAPLVPEEGLSELAATHALRASYFGPDTAQRLFGAEEAVTKRLLELMRDDRAENLTMEQKAIRAQERLTAERGGR